MDILSAIFKREGSSVGTLVPTVVTKEGHTHKLNITSHPVERGAKVSDHAYAEPAEVTMECGFSGGGSLLDFMDTRTWQIGEGLTPAETLDKLLELQESALPVTVVTSKRTYHNMLITSLTFSTEQKTRHVLTCTLTLQQILIADSQRVTVPPKTRMVAGTSTSEVHNAGTKSVVPMESIRAKSGK